MRYLYITSCLALFTSGVFAQSSQIKLANNSLAKLQLGILEKADVKKQLSIIGEGIKAVDAAEKDNRTKNWPETWAIKTYLSSYIALIDENTANADRYFLLAQDAYAKALKLDKFQSNGDLIRAANHNIHTRLQREGSSAFYRNDFSNAYEMLKKVSDFKPADTTIAVNVALCAQNLQDYNNSLTYFLRAKEGGAKNPALFQQISSIYASKFENELAIKNLEEGLKLNQFHPFLVNDYINILLDNEHYEKATKAIESALTNEKRSRTLYFLYGYLQQQQNNNSTAELAYRKALEIDQNYFDALYQLGLAYIQDANEALLKKDTKKFASYINRAEYSLLNAQDINVNNKNVIKLLIDIYTRKNRLDKVQDLKRKLNEF